MNLDDMQLIMQLDPDNMRDRISELPRQCLDAWDRSQDAAASADFDALDHLVVLGMGGSAIGGALLQDLVADRCDVPITVVRDYELPSHARGPATLVIACSYSGNTEETISGFRQALDRNTQCLAITTGGKLSELALVSDVPVLRFDYRSQPRAALGYSFILLLGAIHRFGVVRDYTDDVAEAAAVMEAWQEEISIRKPAVDNAAKQLAARIHGKLPVVYGAGFLAAAANRWKTQLNENAKSWAFFEILPELDHNAVVGLNIPDIVQENTIVVMLRSTGNRARIQDRWDVTRELLARQGVTAEQAWGRGESRLAQILSLIHFGDYVSFYLAMLNEVDPTPVDTIAFLKQRLAELGTTTG